MNQTSVASTRALPRATHAFRDVHSQAWRWTWHVIAAGLALANAVGAAGSYALAWNGYREGEWGLLLTVIFAPIGTWLLATAWFTTMTLRRRLQRRKHGAWLWLAALGNVAVLVGGAWVVL